jgi:hypothetical protein
VKIYNNLLIVLKIKVVMFVYGKVHVIKNNVNRHLLHILHIKNVKILCHHVQLIMMDMDVWKYHHNVQLYKV